MIPLRRAWFLIALILVAALTLGARLFGPGDLYDKDQPKTMACSVDAALNGEWIWPRDMLLEPSTKPPLYNWLDALVLKITPRWGEWTFKVPSIVACLAVAWLCVSATRYLLRDDDSAPVIAMLAGAVWLANAPVMKMAYFSRPDMLLAALLTGAWYAATRAMDLTGPGRTLGSRTWALLFWLCVAGAALTKGPAAVIPLAYVPLAAKLIHGRWAVANRIGWAWGVPLLTAIVGGWALLAYRKYPDAFFAIVNEEAVKRFTTGGPESIAKPVYSPPVWFVSKFVPWSVLMIVGLLLIGPRRWLRHELSPAIVWVALANVAFSLAPGKRADYLLPAYPAAAILAAYAMGKLATLLRMPATAPLLVPLLMAGYLVHYELRRSPEAKSGHTRAVIAFARRVEAIVPRDAPIVYLVKGYHPFLSLLHRHEGNRPSAAHLSPGTYVIAPRYPGWRARAKSGPLPTVIEIGPKQIVPGEVALYCVGDDGVTVEALRRLLEEQYAWNFPPDRYRASRASSSGF